MLLLLLLLLLLLKSITTALADKLEFCRLDACFSSHKMMSIPPLELPPPPVRNIFNNTLLPHPVGPKIQVNEPAGMCKKVRFNIEKSMFSIFPSSFCCVVVKESNDSSETVQKRGEGDDYHVCVRMMSY